MSVFTRISFLFTALLAFNTLFSQTVVKQDNTTLSYFTNTVQVQFNESINLPNIKAYNASTNLPINIVASGMANTFTLTGTYPSEIIKLDYKTDVALSNKTAYLASPSTSSGDIHVYFNHTVDTSVSQGQDAVNLADALDNKLIDYINACNLTLDIAIYNSASPSATTGIAGAINDAYNRGVQVRLIYDGSTSSNMIALLNPAIPTLASPTSFSYGIMHNKFVIFDANSPDANVPVVWTGSTNWTVAQIDGPDRNSVITIQDQTLAAAYKIEFEEMWGSTTALPNSVNSKFGPDKTNNTPHSFVIGGKQVESYFSPSDGTTSHIISAINSANTDIDIATMLITRTDISNTLLDKYNSGFTNINLVVDSQNPTGNKFTTIQAGILPNHAVVFSDSGIMHHKFMVVDNYNTTSDPLVLVGSHNWSSAAENDNDENTLIVHDAGIANQYYQAFTYLYGLAGGVMTVKEAASNSLGIIAYPNPSNGIITIENTNNQILNNTELVIYNVMGNVVMHKKYDSLTRETIDLTTQAAGIYYIQLQAAGKTSHFSIVKK